MTFSVIGHGTPIILLPGLFAGSWIWDEVKSDLISQGYKVYTLDEAIPISMKGSIDFAVLKLEEIINLCDEKPLIAGNSMGGLIALEYARQNQEKIRGVIVSGSPGLTELETGVTLSDLRSGDVDKAYLLAERVFYDKALIPEHGVAEIAQLFGDKRAFLNIAKWLGFSREYDVQHSLNALALDVQLIWGSHDEITPIPPWTRLAKQYPHLSMDIVEQCGHSPMLEKPTAFSQAIVHYATSLLEESVECA
ncbi:2-hydroxy-6-oxo-6-phenylhexa-2,4-dienoate hydrolase [Photobacterium aphoticum]|uniref:2-hydroxy-6-oxo-6-phenylhexa-2,4-dienoate hydrolase n=1 Tax=Photobacterium aphoticum TaxID=754436 RepID=A0A090QKV6_9GAMM|nr:2-hydroxy-6-oxo-6-phenylhexa-2,4-dienoate hydrolase [Photobacterium aphoticum]